MDWFICPKAFIRGLLGLGRNNRNISVGVDHPLGSGVKVEGGVWGGIKEVEYEKEYNSWGPLSSLTGGTISPMIWRRQRDHFGDWDCELLSVGVRGDGVGVDRGDDDVKFDNFGDPNTPTCQYFITLNSAMMAIIDSGAAIATYNRTGMTLLHHHIVVATPAAPIFASDTFVVRYRPCPPPPFPPNDAPTLLSSL